MKKLLTIIATLSLLAIVETGTARAQVTDAVVADIPFEFTVVNMTLPAGRYTVKPFGEMPGNLMAIVSEEGKILRMFTIESAQVNEPPRDAELIFHRVGDHYFLYEIFEQANSLGVMLPKPSAERRLEKEAAVPGESSYVTVAALKTATSQR